MQQEVRNTRVQHKAEEVKLQIRNGGRVVSEQESNERRHRKADRDNDTTNGNVSALEKAHERLDGFPIAFRQRFIQREHDGAAHSKVRQCQHGKHAGKQRFKSHVFLSQARNEYGAYYKLGNGQKSLAAHAANTLRIEF